jgi:hypothetical protein
MTDTTQTSQPGGRSSAAADDIKSAAREASDTAKSAAADAKAKLSERGREKTDRATTDMGDSLHQVAAQMREAGRGLDREEGPEWARQAFSQGADGLERVSGYLREGRLDDFTRDLQSFSRSNPAAFMAGSVAVGFIAARLAKTAAGHVSETSGARETSRASTASTAQAGQTGRSWDEPRSFAPGADGAVSRGGEL